MSKGEMTEDTDRWAVIDHLLWDDPEVGSNGYLPTLTCGPNVEYVLAINFEHAGEQARARWADLAEDDPTEFRCLVGDEVLVAWALGRSAGPGLTAVNSLEDWLDLWLETPKEEWAGYDGSEIEGIRLSDALREELYAKTDDDRWLTADENLVCAYRW